MADFFDNRIVIKHNGKEYIEELPEFGSLTIKTQNGRINIVEKTKTIKINNADWNNQRQTKEAKRLCIGLPLFRF